MATNYDIRPLQLYLQRNLEEIDRVFRANGLRYFLVSGTMLGAVRHNGFIPWDDDVDIAMPRADYERLLKEWKQLLPEYLEFVSAEQDEQYPLPYGKIQDARTTVVEKTYRKYIGGAYLDVFPLDGVPSGALARWWHFTRYLFWYKMLYYSWRDPYKHGHGMSSWVPLMVQKCMKRRFIHRRMRNILMKHDYDQSPFISEHYNRQRRFFPREVFGSPTPIEYEGAMLMGVEKPHEYLLEEYGDYMTLPPEDKRHQHMFFYLDLEHPYRDFIPTYEKWLKSEQTLPLTKNSRT
jgi:lipopolysaccharide cholinephosphotransferase